MKINIFVDNKDFEALPLDDQEEIIEKITDIQRNIVTLRVLKMIKEHRSEEEIKNYLGWDN